MCGSGPPVSQGTVSGPILSRLKARGEISLKMANGGEFATSMRIRWIGSVSDGPETSRSVTAGDLSGALPSQNRRDMRVPMLRVGVTANADGSS